MELGLPLRIDMMIGHMSNSKSTWLHRYTNVVKRSPHASVMSRRSVCLSSHYILSGNGKGGHIQGARWKRHPGFALLLSQNGGLDIQSSLYLGALDP
jgi:hypothetical protein